MFATLISTQNRSLSLEGKHEAQRTHTRAYTYHTAEIGDCGMFVRIGIQQHLSVGVKRKVRPNALPVFSKEVGHSLHLGLRLRERTTVRIIARVRRGSFIYKSEKKTGRVFRQGRSQKNKQALLNWVFPYFFKLILLNK